MLAGGRRGRRPWVILAVLGALLTGALVLGAALQDTEPPRLFLEAPARGAAGAPVTVRVSADEPVTFVLTYGAQRAEAVAQSWEPQVRVEAGTTALRVEATDGAGNVGRTETRIHGVRVPDAQLRAPDAVDAGDPFTVSLSWTPVDAEVDAVTLWADGRALPVVPGEGERYGIAGTSPYADGAVRVRAEWRDGLGQLREHVRTVRVRPDERPVEQLTLSPEVLAVSTPEGKEREARTLAAAYERAARERLWRDPFRLPVEGSGTSGFGRARQYGPGGNVSRHQGEDVGVPEGTPVYATNAGEVRIADTYPIKGGWVMIDHGAGVSSHYFHLSALHVEKGQTVARGEVVGEVGSTGLSTGPHLHWEMRVGKTATDPLAWVDRARP